MASGNPENLRAAARRKHQAATERAETGLQALIASGDPVTFRGLAKTAGVSIDFLYRSPLRARIEQLRATQRRTPPSRTELAPQVELAPSQGSVVRTLTAQLAELKRQHRDEVRRLDAALAAAQGENLELRRRLGRSRSTEPVELPERPDEPEELIDRAPQARGAAG